MTNIENNSAREFSIYITIIRRVNTSYLPQTITLLVTEKVVKHVVTADKAGQ